MKEQFKRRIDVSFCLCRPSVHLLGYCRPSVLRPSVHRPSPLPRFTRLNNDNVTKDSCSYTRIRALVFS